jgi:hypothetical protein
MMQSSSVPSSSILSSYDPSEEEPESDSELSESGKPFPEFEDPVFSPKASSLASSPSLFVLPAPPRGDIFLLRSPSEFLKPRVPSIPRPELFRLIDARFFFSFS